MTVFVDDVAIPYRRMLMCHMWTDGPIEDLLDMVDKIGVQRKWIQGHPTLSHGVHKNASWVHFDICSSKKKLAIKYGATLTDRYGPVYHTNTLLLNHSHPDVASRAKLMLKRIDELRERMQQVQCSVS